MLSFAFLIRSCYDHWGCWPLGLERIFFMLSDKVLEFISSYLKSYHKILEFGSEENVEILKQFTEQIVSFEDCKIEDLQDEVFDFALIDKGDDCIMTAMRTLKPGCFLMLVNQDQEYEELKFWYSSKCENTHWYRKPGVRKSIER